MPKLWWRGNTKTLTPFFNSLASIDSPILFLFIIYLFFTRSHPTTFFLIIHNTKVWPLNFLAEWPPFLVTIRQIFHFFFFGGGDFFFLKICPNKLKKFDYNFESSTEVRVRYKTKNATLVQCPANAYKETIKFRLLTNLQRIITNSKN